MSQTRKYHVDKVSSTQSRKFNTRAERYVINVERMPAQLDIPQALVYLRDLLDDIVTNVLRDVHDHDFVRLVITSPGRLIQTPISIPFVRRDNLSIDRIMDYVEKIVQSAFRWLLEGQFAITLYHVKMLRGGGGFYAPASYLPQSHIQRF